jgi:hypothetical protein
MKRAAIVALFLTLAAAALFAATSSRFSITPSDLKDGETKTFADGDRTIAVHRVGDALELRIDGAGKTRRVVIESTDGEIHIGGGGAPRVYSFNSGGALPRILIDGNMPSIQPRMLFPKNQSWYVCPKDHTMLRVPEAKGNATFKCPLDGTTMEKRKGGAFQFFFDDEEHEEL